MSEILLTSKLKGERLELAAAIAAGLGVSVMFAVFCKILTQ